LKIKMSPSYQQITQHSSIKDSGTHCQWRLT
jgi:hypothetical protein